MLTTATEILAASARTLFPGNEDAVNSAFRKMAFDWHPDRNKSDQATEVFEHLQRARARALGRSSENSITLERDDGSKFRMEFLTARAIDGGMVYVGASSVAYLMGEANSDLVDRGLTRKWKFENDKMKSEMTRFLPQFVREIKLKTGRLVVYRRTPDQILMSDLIAHEKKIVSPHASWMITRMLNIACYLEYAKVSHLAIAPEFLLVSLEHHAVALTGPAMYACDFDRKPKAVPKRTITTLPRLKQADTLDIRFDLQLIRQTALNLMGDPSGNRIRNDPSIRHETAHWVSSAPAKSAIEDYASWEKSLGERKFVKYPTVAQEIYATF